jgi:hypothetical protein
VWHYLVVKKVEKYSGVLSEIFEGYREGIRGHKKLTK